MDFREALLAEMQKSKNKLVENRQIKKESVITEDTEEYLEPRFDSRASFYKKAKVVKKDNGDEELYSYGTHVGGVKGGKPYTKGKFSQTTSRHQKDYFMQKGFDPKKVELDEGKKLTEERYEDGIYAEIEDALTDAGFEVRRYTDAGVLTRNLGWIVSGENGEAELSCDGTWLEESKKLQEGALVDIENAILKSVVDVCNKFGVENERYVNLEMNDAVKFKTDDGTYYVAVEELYDVNESKKLQERAKGPQEIETVVDRAIEDLKLAKELSNELEGKKWEGFINVLEDCIALLSHGISEAAHPELYENCGRDCGKKKEELFNVSPNINIDVSDSNIASGNTTTLDMPIPLPM